MDPLDYERLCAHLLCQAGWRAQATPPGADQGLDIMAEKKGVRLVVQCRLYNRPVGNKAVQEIFTARQHRQAHYAAVVSNAGYTRSAREVAHATGVHLFHHSQLSTLTILDLQPQQDLWS
ncbi:restriction endonuclease [Bombella sp. TMW 2.2559]|uniref:Restriction endonuclease n=1 Tax=Bombella dulcis TaxID=2967339 RepID=A0ABT3WDN2_9PROT|nr:restriction endonuclease [Bombella dulcis]MCX5616958.1 restriction endonuclease [Bombella dulcis]